MPFVPNRAIFVWPWKKISVSVRSLFHQPMDEKIKTWPLRFPAKETLIWRRHCSIGQSCCSMTSKKFLESSSGMKFVYPSVRLANQNPGAFVSVSYTNQIALFPFVCCFCFVRAFSFQGHTKIALRKSVHIHRPDLRYKLICIWLTGWRLLS